MVHQEAPGTASKGPFLGRTVCAGKRWREKTKGWGEMEENVWEKKIQIKIKHLRDAKIKGARNTHVL